MMNKTRTVLVTGASKGIGHATAELFAESGFNVLINYLHSATEAMSLHEKLYSRGFNTAIYQADVSKREQVDSMVKYCVDRFGGIDILVNNAGISRTRVFTDISEPEWDEMINVNLKGVFNCCQSVLPYMLMDKAGKIINISSIWGTVGAACEVHYSAAKAGVIGLTKALAKELGPSNIHVNCVAPGAIDTSMNRTLKESETNDLKERIPFCRFGTPKDIALTVLFLASEEADYYTGQVLSPNGGFVI